MNGGSKDPMAMWLVRQVFESLMSLMFSRQWMRAGCIPNVIVGFSECWYASDSHWYAIFDPLVRDI